MITLILSIIEITSILFSFLQFKDIQHLALSSKSFWSFHSKNKELISILFKDKKYGPKDKWTQRKAAEYGHLDLLKLKISQVSLCIHADFGVFAPKIKDNGINNCDIIDIAAENGHVEMVKYLETKGLKCSQDGINSAAHHGDVKMVKYLYQQGLRCNQNGIDEAALHGYVKMIEYLYTKGLKCSQDGINRAAHQGHVKMVKYLYTKELTCSQNGIDYAAYNGYVKMVKYLKIKGLKCSTNKLILPLNI